MTWDNAPLVVMNLHLGKGEGPSTGDLTVSASHDLGGDDDEEALFLLDVNAMTAKTMAEAVANHKQIARLASSLHDEDQQLQRLDTSFDRQREDDLMQQARAHSISLLLSILARQERYRVQGQ